MKLLVIFCHTVCIVMGCQMTRSNRIFKPGRVLLTSTYEAPTKQRMQNYLDVLEMNCHNSAFDRIHLLCDPHFDKTVLDSACKGCPHAKVFLHSFRHDPFADRYGQRRSSYLYSEFLQFANQHLSGSIVVISNGDIAFDRTIALASRKTLQNELGAFALSRYTFPCPDWVCNEKDPNSDFCWHSLCTTRHFGGGLSFDSFVLQPPIAAEVTELANFAQDAFGAENRFAFLLTQAGYNLTNPCYSIITMHHHCGRKRVNQSAFRVPDTSTFYVRPSALFDNFGKRLLPL